MKKHTNHILVLTILFLISLTIFPQFVYGQLPQTCSDFIGLINRIAAALQAIILTLATIVVLIAAYKYMTAGDDAQKVKSAHQTIAWAVVGLFVALMSVPARDIVTNFLIGAVFPISC